MTSPPPGLPPPRPRLIVRLRNWVGDVTLGLPALERIAAAGYELQLVGKGWAADLLAGHGWPVTPLPATARARIALLRRLKADARRAVPGFAAQPVQAVCWPYSFSSALEFRLAGLRAIGHRYEGRSWLLARAVPRPQGLHELAVYWQLASALLGRDAPLPKTIDLRPGAAQQAAAEALMAAHGLQRGRFVVICPFAGGTWSGEDKTWPAFPDFAARVLPGLGLPVVVCPGPGEEPLARERYAGALRLDGVKLGVYAALLQRAAAMVSNDTGPGHVAAAVGAPLVSVLGPSDPAQWGAWGPTVRVVKGETGWPRPEAVEAALRDALLASTPR